MLDINILSILNSPFYSFLLQDISKMSFNASSSNSSLHPLTSTCFKSEMSIYVFSTMFITNLLLLPVFVSVYYLGYQQWRQQRSSSTSATSHSDLFTYHAIAVQLNEFLGLSLFFCGGYNKWAETMFVGQSLLKVTATGQALFHILTCVEHYLAVVHPVAYLHLKQAGEVWIRNVSIGCVWLVSFGWLPVYYVGSYELIWIFYLCILAPYLLVVPFCSISVLCALKRPGPGKGCAKKDQAHQSKQRAFFTISVILGVLLFRFVGNVSGNVIYSSTIVSSDNFCVALMFLIWLDVPSGLVLPLLFLHREGKLQCCKQNTKSGWFK